MEERAPYGQPAPASRNLTAPLAKWLRGLGFSVLEQGGTLPTSLAATWRASDGLLYEVSYAFAQHEGVFQLLARQDDATQPHHGLVHKAQVKRLREVRFLLLSNTFYREARQAALDAGTLLPAHAQSTPTAS